MDVDNDIDSNLLVQFSSMGTTDKEVLIQEFQKLLGNQLNPEGCAFFLDMNNWNLQAAICSYYDYEQPNMKLPCMAFVKDITIGEGESVPPSTRFVKTWRIQNIGDEAWPPACSLKFVAGEQFGNIERIMVDALQPGAVTDASVDMISPSSNGIYQGQWRMITPTGVFFGEIIWVILQVEDHGLLGVTQAMSSFGGDVFAHPQSDQTDNPFASPSKSSDKDSVGCHNAPVFGSPTPSIVAQHGSAPNSPHVDNSLVSVQLNGSINHSLADTGARLSLFQNGTLPSTTTSVNEGVETSENNIDSVDMT